MNALSRLFALVLAGATLAEARANAVLDWNALLLQAVRADNSGPNLASRNLALLHLAIFDSVNAITRTHQPYGFTLPLKGETSIDAAVAGAAHEVIAALHPSVAASARKLVAPLQAQGGPAVQHGLALGREIARMALRSREGDQMSADSPYIPNAAPGQWRRTPPRFRPPASPQWRDVNLFALPEKESFLPPPPPPLESAEYAAAFDEVKCLGAKNSPARSREQTEIALFWSDFSYTATPPGHWHEIAASICRERNLSLPETARLFALLSVAQADVAVICWESKFRHNLWRPITAIHRAQEDGNPDTAPDPSWDHLLAAPPFPSYVSGHSAFSKASAEILAHFFQSDAIAFTARSDSIPGVTRQYTSLAACADEIGMSRIYGGIHFSFDNVHGKEMGRRVAQFISTHLLLPHRDGRE